MDFEIDLDSECVWLDDAWLNRDDLVRKIRTMMDAGQFEIARPSQALEALTRQLASARLLALRISPDMSDALNAAAQSTGRPVGALAREAISTWLGSGAATSPGASATTQPNTPSVAPPPRPPPPREPPTPSVVVSGQPAAGITTEPVSAEEAAHAVALKPKRKEGEDVEKRWFDK
jgi:hypothetical protein